MATFTIADACDGAGACVGSVEEQGGCLPVSVPGKAVLQMRDRTGTSQDRLQWKWNRGTATTLGDFGDPASTTDYALCMYDETGAGGLSLALTAEVPGGNLCSGKPCWRSRGVKGYRYKDKNGFAGGIRSIRLTAGGDGKAKLSVKAKAGFLMLPSLPPLQNPGVVMQLKNSQGVCWASRFDAPALVSDTERFKDKGE